jgi:hypothetical protein
VPVEKQIVSPGEALKGPTPAGETAKEITGGVGTEGTPPVTVPTFEFVKNFGVADVIVFADKTTFSFRIIERNSGGYAPNSFVKTTDAKLAANLREAAKNSALGIVEIT